MAAKWRGGRAIFLGVMICLASVPTLAPAFIGRTLLFYSSSTSSGCGQSVFETDAGDFDGDGDADVSVQGRVYENLSGDLLQRTERNLGLTPRAVVDFDSDGKDDMLTWGIAGLRWHDITLGGTPSYTTEPITPNSTHFARVIEFDGDPFVEIVASHSDGTIRLYNRDSTGAVGETLVGTHGPGRVAGGDLDGDGDLDIAARGGDQVVWFENEGGTPLTFAKHSVTLLSGTHIEVFDPEGDGANDLLLAGTDPAGSPDSQLFLVRNMTGDASSWEVEVIRDTSTIREIELQDVTLDGVMNIVFADGNRVAWLDRPTGADRSWGYRALLGGTGWDSVSSFWFNDADSDGDLDVGLVWYDYRPGFIVIPGTCSGGAQWYENTLPRLTALSGKFETLSGGNIVIPGRSAQMVATIRNDWDQPLTNIVATPSSLTTGLVVSPETPIIASLDPGEIATLTTEVFVPPEFTCGTPISARFAITSDEGFGCYRYIQGTIGRFASKASGLSLEEPVEIPDGDFTGVSTSLNLLTDPAYEITETHYFLEIRHPRRGDLQVQLEHPDGTTVTLFQSPGDTAADISQQGELAQFDGRTAAGEYKLRVVDGTGGNVGEIVAFDLIIAYSGRTCTLPTFSVLRDHVLGQGITPLIDLDLNDDGRIDVADLVYAINLGL